jgi:hypothetical protein
MEWRLVTYSRRRRRKKKFKSFSWKSNGYIVLGRERSYYEL